MIYHIPNCIVLYALLMRVTGTHSTDQMDLQVYLFKPKPDFISIPSCIVTQVNCNFMNQFSLHYY